jgi:hypothetical protein
MPNGVNAAVFGWDFQVNAALVLMLEKHSVIQKIKVEGNTQDIELYMIGNKQEYYQAKSSADPSDMSHVTRNLKSALKTLSNIDKPYLLVSYITNSDNPTCNNDSYFSGFTKLTYLDLPPQSKVKIDTTLHELLSENEINKELDKSKFEIRRFDFYGSEKINRYKEVKRIICEFLYNVLGCDTGFSQELLEVWQHDLFHNATISVLTLSKEQIMWPIVYLVCESPYFDVLNENEIDDDTEEFISLQYKEFINKNTQRFEFVTKVLTDFSGFCRDNDSIHKNVISREFILTSWSSYLDEFRDLHMDESEKTILIQTILRTILKQKRKIIKIKEALSI